MGRGSGRPRKAGQKGGDRRTFAEQIAAAQGHTGDEPHLVLPGVLQSRPKELEPASDRVHPRYPSEENRVKATYDLDQALIDAVRAIAVRERLGRNYSRVAEALLAYAVAQLEAGEIRLEVEQHGPDWWLVAVEK